MEESPHRTNPLTLASEKHTERREVAISDDPKVYSDDEVAIILREAARLADSPRTTIDATSGLSLQQIKAAASEAGLDPVFVERAALRLSQRGSESLFERVIGGPVRHRESIHLPVSPGDAVSAHMLAALRAHADILGEGRADASGFYLRGLSRGNRVSVAAHAEQSGTRVQVLVDRSALLFQTLFFANVGIVMWLLIVVESIGSYPEALAVAAVPIGVLAAARAFWKSSTRAVQGRTAMLLETVRDAARDWADRRGTGEPGP